MANLRIRDADGLFTGFGQAQAGETLTAIADAQIPPWVLPQQAWYDADQPEGQRWRGRAFSALQEAGEAAHLGLIEFSKFVREHAEGVPASAVAKVQQGIYQAHRGTHLIARNAVTGKDFTKAQRIAILQTQRYGPSDASVVTDLGVYNPEGLFAIFALVKAEGEQGALAAPAGPWTWVDLDTSNWTADAEGNANAVPVRLALAAALAQNVPSAVNAVSAYLNIHDRSWLDDL